MDLIKKTEEYFNLFSIKDLDGLEKLFHDNVTLIDWEGEWQGKNQVLEINKKLFENDMSINYYRLSNDQLTTYGQLKIRVGELHLKVIDVIDWTEDGKIIKIEAYKG